MAKYLRDLNNHVTRWKLVWTMAADVLDKKRGRGWWAVIFVEGVRYQSTGYFNSRSDALESAAFNALVALGVLEYSSGGSG
ncbi:hypothetical protein FRB94_003854 [Tulasnella sp. JGI-2019a]|nr:hypothetical protein FRB94_003854 [Tulasnella sp. JGI-2019a]KAG9034735.1 hypothetical protein FRB95_012685 [Tulasnella sp. JGI-2019a]